MDQVPTPQAPSTDERSETADTLQDLRDTIREFDSDCVDDPEDLMNDINCNSVAYGEALDKAIAILRSIT